MAPSEVTEDYYAILEVPQHATIDTVKRSYRRLAKVLHPDKNSNTSSATASFQSLVAAWETIKDPVRRREYDQKWVHIRQCKSTREQVEKQRAGSFRTEPRDPAEETTQRKEQAILLERLRNLEGHRVSYQNQIYELERGIEKLATDLNRLRDKDDWELRKEREGDSWWTYITSPILGKLPKETEEQKQQQAIDRIQRLNVKRIKENDLGRQAASVQSLKEKLQDVNGKISAIEQKVEEMARAREANRQEQSRKEQEAKRRAEQQEARERVAKMQAERVRRQEEETARAAQQAREAQEVREAEEGKRRAYGTK
ncbi:MAG: hypothetical protein Q9211_002653 [Gyalolechia sp. 1 TL-2023]